MCDIKIVRYMVRVLPAVVASAGESIPSPLVSPNTVSRGNNQWKVIYDTRKSDESIKANMLMRLCTAILPCLIKYNDVNSNTLHVPFKMALSFGKNGVKAGITAGPGISFRFKISTTTNTNMDMAATKRNMNLSVMFL